MQNHTHVSTRSLPIDKMVEMQLQILKIKTSFENNRRNAKYPKVDAYKNTLTTFHANNVEEFSNFEPNLNLV